MKKAPIQIPSYKEYLRNKQKSNLSSEQKKYNSAQKKKQADQKRLLIKQENYRKEIIANQAKLREQARFLPYSLHYTAKRINTKVGRNSGLSWYRIMDYKNEGAIQVVRGNVVIAIIDPPWKAYRPGSVWWRFTLPILSPAMGTIDHQATSAKNAMKDICRHWQQWCSILNVKGLK